MRSWEDYEMRLNIRRSEAELVQAILGASRVQVQECLDSDKFPCGLCPFRENKEVCTKDEAQRPCKHLPAALEEMFE